MSEEFCKCPGCRNEPPERDHILGICECPVCKRKQTMIDRALHNMPLDILQKVANQ